MTLYLLLDRARESAGVALPPPFPSPILTYDNIVSISATISRGGPSEPGYTDHHIRDSDVWTIMRWLHGQSKHIPLTWPENTRIGTLNVTLKDGETVRVHYYQAPAGELRFSINNIHYELKNRYASSSNLDEDIRLVIMNEALDGKSSRLGK